MSIVTIKATDKQTWQKHNLKHFSRFQDLYTTYEVRAIGRYELVGKWYYIDEDHKTIYYGFWTIDYTLGDPNTTFAKIFDDDEVFHQWRKYFLDQPESSWYDSQY